MASHQLLAKTIITKSSLLYHATQKSWGSPRLEICYQLPEPQWQRTIKSIMSLNLKKHIWKFLSPSSTHRSTPVLCSSAEGSKTRSAKHQSRDIPQRVPHWRRWGARRSASNIKQEVLLIRAIQSSRHLKRYSTSLPVSNERTKKSTAASSKAQQYTTICILNITRTGSRQNFI